MRLNSNWRFFDDKLISVEKVKTMETHKMWPAFDFTIS